MWEGILHMCHFSAAPCRGSDGLQFRGDTVRYRGTTDEQRSSSDLELGCAFFLCSIAPGLKPGCPEMIVK